MKNQLLYSYGKLFFLIAAKQAAFYCKYEFHIKYVTQKLNFIVYTEKHGSCG